MAAWVIREDRLGEPQRRLPARGDRGARARRLRGDRAGHGRGRELQQRLGRARQARLGVRLRRPSAVRPPHRRLRRLGRRLEGRRGRHALEARRRGRRALQPGLLRGSRGPRPRSPRRAVPEDLGLRDDAGARSRSSRRSRPSSCCPSRRHLAWEEAASYGLTYFTAYRMLMDRAKIQAGDRVLIWGAAGGLGVFATQLVQGGRRRERRRRLLGRRRASSSCSSAPRATSTAASSTG